MSNYINNKLWLIGASQMAIDYAKVLHSLNTDYEVIGRGEESARKFEQECKKNVWTGGLKRWLAGDTLPVPKAAIVAVGMEQLSEVTIQLLQANVKRVLVEKPAGLNCDQIRKVADETKKQKAEVLVAYNRRFYASTLKAKEFLKEDGGVTSFNFEFTEWSHEIEKLKKAPGVKENWFLANSTHVVDLAFYLGGKPKEICCYTGGGLEWHPTASIFAGAGVSETGALFSYQANWESAGRWSLEILTKKHRLIFRPLEKLQVQKIGSVNIEFVDIDDELDIKFKPGLYRQTKAFIKEPISQIFGIKEHEDNLKYYEQILGVCN